MPTDPTTDPVLDDIYRRAQVIRRSRSRRQAGIAGAALVCLVAVPLALTGRSDQDDVDVIGDATTTTDATTSTSTTAAATSSTLLAPEATTPSTIPDPPPASELPSTFLATVDSRAVVVSTATGDVVRYLTPEEGPLIYTVTSHDGSFVYYSQLEGETCSDMFRRPIGGGPAEPVVVDTGVGAMNPVASLDGRLLAYDRYICPAEAIEPDRYELVIRDLVTGEEAIVETDALHGLPEAFDASGRRLLYGRYGPDNGGQYVYDLATGESRPVEVPEGCTASAGHWLTDDEIALQQYCGLEDVEAAVQLVFLDPSSGRPTRPAFDLPERAHVASVDRTGRWLAVSIAFVDPPAGPYTESTSILDLLSGEVAVAGLPGFRWVMW